MTVSADGKGIVSQSGGLLLTRTLAATGLDRGLSAALGRWRAPRAAHDPGKTIADLAVTLALGGDCLADIALLRAEPGLFGPVASDPVVSRLVAKLANDALRALKAIRAARAAARQRAWELAGDAAPGPVVLAEGDAGHRPESAAPPRRGKVSARRCRIRKRAAVVTQREQDFRAYTMQMIHNTDYSAWA